MKRSLNNRWKLTIAALIAAAPLLLTGCGEEVVEAEPPVRPVKTVTLGETAATNTRSFPGTLRASERAQLSFRVSGPLVELPAREGLSVRRGQLLAQIDPRDFQTAVDNLEAQLATLRAERSAMDTARPEDIARAEANLTAARARLLEATANFRRYQRLYENDNVSKAEFDQRRAARDVADADVLTADESLKIARSGARVEDIEAMEARIRSLTAQLRKAQDDLKDTSLRAPYTGLVAERYVDNFEFVQSRSPILGLQNIEVMELVSQIPETIVAQYRDSDRGSMPAVFATFPSLPDIQLPAKATEFSAQADPVTRTYSVTVQIPQPPRGMILAGMTGELHIPQEEAASDAFIVPSASVFIDENGQGCVWKVNSDNSVTKLAVEAGEMSGPTILLTSGVSRGDQIVTAGASYLDDADKVRAITSELRERR
jgi:membrane fusion protein, multidrug efflux system